MNRSFQDLIDLWEPPAGVDSVNYQREYSGKVALGGREDQDDGLLLRACCDWAHGGVSPFRDNGIGEDFTSPDRFRAALSSDILSILKKMNSSCAGFEDRALFFFAVAQAKQKQHANSTDEDFAKELAPKFGSYNEKMTGVRHLLLDLIRILANGGRPLPQFRASNIDCLLAPTNSEMGVRAHLKLELLKTPEDWEDELFASPYVVLAHQEEPFSKAIQTAKLFATNKQIWSKGYSVRWDLIPYSKPFLPVFTGNSLGGAFGMALQELFGGVNERRSV